MDIHQRFLSGVIIPLFLILPSLLHAEETLRDTIITQDTVWRERVTVDGVVMVAPQATLSIRPGTRVSFVGYSSVIARSALVVEGRIDATGTPDAPISFEPASSSPWGGVTLVDSRKNNRLESVSIRGAAVSLRIIRSHATITDTVVDGGGTGVETIDAVVSMRGGEIRNTDIGISINGGDLTIRGTTISGNGIGVNARSAALTCRETRFIGNRRRGLFTLQTHLLAEDSLFDGNRIAAAFDGGEGVFRRNRVQSSGGDGVHVANARLSIVENLFLRNAGNSLTLRDGLATVSRNLFERGQALDIVNLGTLPLHLPGNWWGDDPQRGGRLGGIGSIDVRPLLTERPPWP